MKPSTIQQQYAQKFAESRRLHQQAIDLFPNGVTHDERFLRPFPVYINRALGARKWDVQGQEIVDWWSGHGSMLLGHCQPDIVAAVEKQVRKKTQPGGCHALEVEWGKLIRELMPSVEHLRFVSSGTEASMMALRLARSFTGKQKALRFLGHFHGWGDLVIQEANPPYDTTVPGWSKQHRKEW